MFSVSTYLLESCSPTELSQTGAPHGRYKFSSDEPNLEVDHVLDLILVPQLRDYRSVEDWMVSLL